MADAVIVSTARTPIGEAFRGIFNGGHGAEFSLVPVRASVVRPSDALRGVDEIALGPPVNY